MATLRHEGGPVVEAKAAELMIQGSVLRPRAAAGEAFTVGLVKAENRVPKERDGREWRFLSSSFF